MYILYGNVTRSSSRYGNALSLLFRLWFGSFCDWCFDNWYVRRNLGKFDGFLSSTQLYVTRWVNEIKGVGSVDRRTASASSSRSSAWTASSSSTESIFASMSSISYILVSKRSRVCVGTYPLVLSSFGGLVQDSLNGLDVEFFVDLLEYLIPLLQTMQNGYLDKRELNGRNLQRPESVPW